MTPAERLRTNCPFDIRLQMAMVVRGTAHERVNGRGRLMATLAEGGKVVIEQGVSTVAIPEERGEQLATFGLRHTIARRLLPRLVADLVAVSVGLGIYWAWSGRPPRMQILFALAFVGVAALADAFHVRLERSYVEEFVLAMKVAVVALLLTAVVGFLIDRTLSRVLFLALALTLVITRPIATPSD